MSVGGHIIEIRPDRLPDGTEAVRLWVVDPACGDETVVFSEPFTAPDGPALGDMIWWQAGRIYFDHDRRSLAKIGASASPTPPPKGPEHG